jgi:hypothetical protein
LLTSKELALEIPPTLLAIADEVIAYPSISRLWRREFANQRPPDFLFVFNERLGLLRSVVPDRHAEVRVAVLDRWRVERLAKSIGEMALMPGFVSETVGTLGYSGSRCGAI